MNRIQTIRTPLLNIHIVCIQVVTRRNIFDAMNNRIQAQIFEASPHSIHYHSK